MEIRYTPKQMEILAVIRDLSQAAKPCSVYDLADNLSYKVKRDALLHSIRILKEANFVVNSHKEGKRQIFAITEVGKETLSVEADKENIRELLRKGWHPLKIRNQLTRNKHLIRDCLKEFDKDELKKLQVENNQRAYFLGIIDEENQQKRCYKCENWKPFSEFHSNKNRLCGLSPSCKACIAEYQATPEFKEKARLKSKAKREAWLAKNPPKPKMSIEEKKIRSLINGSRSRAKEKGLEHNIKYGDFPIPEYCPVMPWVKLVFDGSDRWAAASLDRIIPAKGYTQGNIQVMSMRANLMKNNSNDNERKAFADWALKQAS